MHHCAATQIFRTEIKKTTVENKRIIGTGWGGVV